MPRGLFTAESVSSFSESAYELRGARAVGCHGVELELLLPFQLAKLVNVD